MYKLICNFLYFYIDILVLVYKNIDLIFSLGNIYGYFFVKQVVTVFFFPFSF